ncbi:MAG: MBL fold metallo-hydrolase [Dokdonella sp.]
MSPLTRKFFHLDTGSWTHVIVDSLTRRAAIVDPVLHFDVVSGRANSNSAQRVLENIDTASLTVEWILQTHVPADHPSAAAWMRTHLSTIDHRVSGGIGDGVCDAHATVTRRLDKDRKFGGDGTARDRLFEDGDRLPMDALEVEVVATPGHTADEFSYRVGDTVVATDTLFAPRLGTGRCEFPGADAAVLCQSIQRLFAMPNDTRLFLCHDSPPDGEEPTALTAVGAQKAGNVMLQAHTSEQDFIEACRARDTTLTAPTLPWPSLQINFRGGRLPAAERNGVRIVRRPVRDAT